MHSEKLKSINNLFLAVVIYAEIHKKIIIVFCFCYYPFYRINYSARKMIPFSKNRYFYFVFIYKLAGCNIIKHINNCIQKIGIALIFFVSIFIQNVKAKNR